MVHFIIEGVLVVVILVLFLVHRVEGRGDKYEGMAGKTNLPTAFSDLRSEMSLLWKATGELQRSIGKVQHDVSQTIQSIKSFEERTEFLNEKDNVDVLEIRELWRLFGKIDQEIESMVQKRLQKRREDTVEAGALRILHAMQFANSDTDSYGAPKGIQGEGDPK